MGDYQKALSYYQEALKISQQIGDKAMKGSILNNIGFIYDRIQDNQKTLGLLSRSFENQLADRT